MHHLVWFLNSDLYHVNGRERTDWNKFTDSPTHGCRGANAAVSRWDSTPHHCVVQGVGKMHRPAGNFIYATISEISVSWRK